MLVIVQLDGGNDAINTLVPHSDEGYERYRRVLRLDKRRLIRINDQVGLNPALGSLSTLLEHGQLAMVPGVAYPNPNRSHFESMAIWQTARLQHESDASPGWIGRAWDSQAGVAAGIARPATAVHVGEGSLPLALRGRRFSASSLASIEDLRLPEGLLPSLAQTRLGASPGPETEDGVAAFVRRSLVDSYSSAKRAMERLTPSAAGPTEGYPDDVLGQRLRTISQLLRAGLGARVFYTVQPGYDTHAGQLVTHDRLLGVLASSLKAFFRDLSTAGLASRVVVLCFSEFGRRVAENSSAGTDHGTAGLVLLAGPAVRGGLHGRVPSLTDLPDGDPRWSVDFRQVYATVLESWLGLASEAALGGKYELLPIFRDLT